MARPRDSTVHSGRTTRRRRQRRKPMVGPIKSRSWGMIAALGAVAVFAAGILTYAVTVKRHDAAPPSGVRSFGKPARDHVSGPVHYAQTPPVGGKHSATPLTCGVYASPVPSENAVHSLEHGAVWITYRPSLSTADVQRLRDLAKGQSYLIVSPDGGLPSRVVASAWGKQLVVPDPTDSRLRRFISYYEQGPQAPEPGAACTGVGSPIA